LTFCSGEWELCRAIQLQTARLPRPSLVERPASSRSPIVRCLPLLCSRKNVYQSLWYWGSLHGLGPPRIIGKPAPFRRAFVEVVDAAIRAQSPRHGLSALQRTWLAFCVTAVLVTNAMGWARFERARLGPSSLAALSWMFRPSPRPWDELLVARVRVILRPSGLTAGRLVLDDTDNPRSQSAKARAHLDKRRDKDRGGYLWGHRLVLLFWVTPTIAIPVGCAVYQPAPAFSAWDKQDKALQKPGVATPQRPPTPPAHPAYPTQQPLALGL
jgi:hypothetical protein